MSLLLILLIPLALYFLMIRPQRQRIQAQRNLIAALTPGDRVVTAGGMLGTLVAIHGDTASVEVAHGVVIDLLVPAISRRVDSGAPIVEDYVDNIDNVDDVDEEEDGDHDDHDGEDDQTHPGGEESDPVAPTEES